jgi:hypothetical protein
MGRGIKSKYLYLLDFGLAKKYRSSTTLAHYRMIKKKNLTGTARYASINALNGLTQSRRDDLEAVGYVLMYFLRGKLPWQGLRVKNKEDRYHKIMEIKKETSPSLLCHGYPKEFKKYVEYTRNLEYEQDPDYEMLKDLFKTVLVNNKISKDNFYVYDWDIDNKNLNTITTNNTSNKEEKNFFSKYKYNITNTKNMYRNKINDIDVDKNFSSKAKKTKEDFYSTKILYKKIMNTEEKINNFSKNKIKKKLKDFNLDGLDDDFEYKNIMEMTDEGKNDDIKKLPNVFGYIHSKTQLEKQVNKKKEEDENKCYIF